MSDQSPEEAFHSQQLQNQNSPCFSLDLGHVSLTPCACRHLDSTKIIFRHSPATSLDSRHVQETSRVNSASAAEALQLEVHQEEGGENRSCLGTIPLSATMVPAKGNENMDHAPAPSCLARQ